MLLIVIITMKYIRSRWTAHLRWTMNSSSPGERLVAPCDDLSVTTKSSAEEATPLTEATAVTG